MQSEQDMNATDETGEVVGPSTVTDDMVVAPFGPPPDMDAMVEGLADAITDRVMRLLLIPWTLDSNAALPKGWVFVKEPDYEVAPDPTYPPGSGALAPKLVDPGIIAYRPEQTGT